MKINGANTNNNQIKDFLEDISPGRSDRPRPCNGQEAAACLSSDYCSLISRALQTAQSGTTVVQRSSKLLASGELDSLQAGRSAAENILKFGI